MKLTIKQKKFADEYIISGNAAEAAILAGYNKKYAATNTDKLLKNTNVKAYIDERMAKLDDIAIAKQDEILKYLTSVMRGETESSEIVIEGQGNGVSEAKIMTKPPSEKERIKAAELLGKRYGTWVDKVSVDADIDIKIVDDMGGEL